MGFKETHDIAVKVGSYQKDGQTKGRYENVGYVLTGEDGSKMHFINRTFNPAGVPHEDGKAESAVLVSVFEIKEKQGEKYTRDNPGQGTGFQSDVPF